MLLFKDSCHSNYQLGLCYIKVKKLTNFIPLKVLFKPKINFQIILIAQLAALNK